jgi:hypothetical protein
MTQLVDRRPMSDDEILMARHLGCCSFLPASFDKRWSRALAGEADRQDPTITEKEAELLRRMVKRYRRQIDPAVVALADKPLMGFHAAKRAVDDALGLFKELP